MIDIATLRRQYAGKEFRRKDLKGEPLEQFHQWISEAQQCGIEEPNIMTLSTVDAENAPDVRIVLLRGYSEEGFRFFTNYQSQKAAELDLESKAALHFFWEPLHRQVKARGTVHRLSGSDSDTYFASRPREHQIAAWASQQSAVIQGRTTLEQAVDHFNDLYRDKEIPRPPHWGGYCLRPVSYEFWQGRENRLHDRFRYTLARNQWQIDRLAP